jgi:hypothetical protein
MRWWSLVQLLKKNAKIIFRDISISLLCCITVLEKRIKEPLKKELHGTFENVAGSV